MEAVGDAGDVQNVAQERLRALMQTMRAFAEATSDYPVLLDTIARRMAHLLGDACLIAMVDPSGERIDTVAVASRDEKAERDLRAALEAPLAMSADGAVVRVARTGKAMLVPRLSPEELARLVVPRFHDLVVGLGVVSLLAVPLLVDGHRVGALAVCGWAQDRRPFDEEDLAFARGLADHAALAIANARLLEAQRREIDERTRAEEEAQKLAALVQNSIDLVGMASLDGRVLFLNDAGRALLGIPADFDVGTLALADLHVGAGVERVEKILRERSWQGEATLRHFQTRELIPTQASSFVVRGRDGTPSCLATVQRDLRATRSLQAQLALAQKLDAVGQVAGGLAHDFNNILMVIESYSEMLVDALPPGSEARADATEILQAARRADALTRQLLAFTRKQVLEPRVLAVDDVVLRMESLARRVLGTHVAVRVELGTGLGPVRADPGQLEQVVLNLVLNARDAMPSGGTLTLSTRDAVVPPGGPAGGPPPGRYTELAVGDTGRGVDESTRARLFEPFFTTKPVGKGTGLGLAIVKGIVEQSGGHVVVESEPGRGACFRLLFPRLDAAAAVDATEGEVPESVRRGNGERILLVDDDAQVRQLVRQLLGRAGYDVVDADGPTDALLALDREPWGFALLVTDVVMPGMSGSALARHAQARSPRTRVLFLSGFAEEVLGRHGILQPGVDLLRKPTPPAALLRRVREILDR